VQSVKSVDPLFILHSSFFIPHFPLIFPFLRANIIVTGKPHPHMEVKMPSLSSSKAGRPDIDAFETARHRENRAEGFFVAFGNRGRGNRGNRGQSRMA